MVEAPNNSGRKLVEINVCVQSRVSLGIGLLTPIAASEESRAGELGGNVQFTAATASSTFTVGTDYRSMQCAAAHLSCGAPLFLAKLFSDGTEGLVLLRKAGECVRLTGLTVRPQLYGGPPAAPPFLAFIDPHRAAPSPHSTRRGGENCEGRKGNTAGAC